MKACFVSLGCDKNLVDTEHMMAILSKDGYDFVSDPEDADVAIINSCCFIADALEESINTIIEIGKLKTEGNLKALILAGCLGQRFTDGVLEDLPEVDGIVGTNSYDELSAVIKKALTGEKEVIKKDFSSLPSNEKGRFLTNVVPYSYLKIAEGCDKHCTYCIIPSIRGDFRSVPLNELVEEAKMLAASGVKELNLVAQEVTLWGVDLYGKKSLTLLLEQLSLIDGIEWIRLLYCYPEEINEELVSYMASNPKICHYIDMPIQHCSDTILRRMGRKTSKADILEKISLLREKMPDIALRTTLICGFPGETEENHKELLQFVRETAFDRLGCFAYSQEDGTPAAKFEDQIEEDVKNTWRDEVMALQQEIIFSTNQTLVGKTLSCFVEGKVEDGVYAARTYRDAPEVDGYIFIETNRELISGDIVSVRVTDFKEYDLIGGLQDEFTK
ncbi:MAG: 30S ribosomal protein S12 methylthiotransferase RimO [Lachnospiraceae bacterium]|nr:30S ribosomal protein S12 methylthiotransferase RimO [Lachnospiraceae bacterium]